MKYIFKFISRININITSLIIIFILSIVNTPSLAIVINSPLFDEDISSAQPRILIELGKRKNAKQFANINHLLTTKNYKAAIDIADDVLKNYAYSGLAYEILGTAYFLDGQVNNAIKYLRKAIKLEPDQSGPLTKLGVVFMEQDKLEEAEKLLLNAIQKKAENRYAHQRLGLLYEYQGKAIPAIKHFRLGLLGTDSRYIGVAINLSRLLSQLKYYSESIDVLEPRLPLNITFADAQLVLAKAYLGNGDLSQAHERFQKVLQLEKFIPQAMLGLARTYREEGKLKEARKTIEKLNMMEPGYGPSQIEEGEIMMLLNNEYQAQKAFERAESIGIKRSDINHRIALLHLERKEFSKAYDVYLAMVQNNTANEFVYAQLSELNTSKGEIKEGASILQKGLKKYPQSAYLHLRLGSYEAALGRYEAAIPNLRKATNLAPDDIVIWKAYAFSLARANRKSEAVKASFKLHQLQPGKVEPAVFYASQLENNNQVNKAEVIYNKVIKDHPNHAVALNNLANILAGKSKFSEARVLAEQAANLITHASILDTLGWILFKQGNFKESFDVLNKANEISPEYAIAWYHKGLVLRKMNQITEASKSFKKALSIDSSALWAAEAEANL